jgi:hypothetical protein
MTESVVLWSMGIENLEAPMHAVDTLYEEHLARRQLPSCDMLHGVIDLDLQHDPVEAGLRDALYEIRIEFARGRYDSENWNLSQHCRGSVPNARRFASLTYRRPTDDRLRRWAAQAPAVPRKLFPKDDGRGRSAGGALCRSIPDPNWPPRQN